MVPNEKDLVSEISRVGAAKVLGFLAAVLRGKQTERACRHTVRVRNFERAALP